ncbi:MAG: hypothetical protein A2X94_05720 [Bdellovibrionales bacterium GWB1_55_8]|nr:MAG: hypothetical protein A2X94_05720 [Bdellovibrionales bacterium GWB1_55_8]
MAEHGFAFGDAYVRVSVFEASGRSSAPTLYFLHGRFGRQECWKPLVQQLPQFRRVVLDFPGFGSSFSARERGFSLAEHVKLANELLDRIPPLQSSSVGAILVGHDFGGTVASMVAVQSPGRVAGLILVNAASPCEPLEANAGVFGWAARWEAFHELRNTRGLWPEVEGMLIEPWLSRNSRRALVRSLKSLERTWPGQYERNFWRETLKKSDLAALILWGGRDTVHPLEKGVALARAFPFSDFYVDPAVGHWPNLDSTAWVGARLREFVFRLGLSRSTYDRKSLSR